MARTDMGTVKVVTSRTRVQITTSIASGSKVRASAVALSIEIAPRATNSGAAMYVGTSNVTTTYGKRIAKGDSYTFTNESGGDRFDTFYMDADSGGDLADWTVVFN